MEEVVDPGSEDCGRHPSWEEVKVEEGDLGRREGDLRHSDSPHKGEFTNSRAEYCFVTHDFHASYSDVHQETG